MDNSGVDVKVLVWSVHCLEWDDTVWADLKLSRALIH